MMRRKIIIACLFLICFVTLTGCKKHNVETEDVTSEVNEEEVAATN